MCGFFDGLWRRVSKISYYWDMAKRHPNKGEYTGATPLPDLKQEFFCELYTASLTTFYGHGQNCYAFAYGHQKKIDTLRVNIIGAATTTGRGAKKHLSEYSKTEREIKRIENVCKASATRLLTNVYIKARINWRLDEAAEDKIMDREAMRVVQQMHNLDAKMRAIERFDKIKGRIIEKVDLKHTFEPIIGFEYVRPEQP